MGFLSRQPRVRTRSSWRGLALVLVFALTTVVGFSSWRAYAQRPANEAVQLRGGNERQRFENLDEDRGATYRWLESQATRTSTRFADAIAVSERDTAGELRTMVRDMAGTELATFNVQHGSGGVDTLEYRQAGVEPLRTSGKDGLNPSLEWGNRQAYLLWKEQQAVRRGPLEWQGRLMRPRGADRRSSQLDPIEVKTEWPDGLVATATRASGARRHVLNGTPLRGRVITSRLRKNGIDVGHTQYYESEQVFTWVFPGLTEGLVDQAALAPIGGLPFTPDAEWANVQSLAFYTFHTAVKERGAVAPQANRSGVIHKIASLFVPTLFANEPGCDNLHWLDSTIYRPCCDQHDRCYEKFGCDWKTWWQIWSSWTCDVCNGMVLYCFGTGGKVPFRQLPW
jgi:hypothetical protein